MTGINDDRSGVTLAKTIVRSTVTPKGSNTESLCFSIADSIYVDYGNSSKPACLQAACDTMTSCPNLEMTFLPANSLNPSQEHE